MQPSVAAPRVGASRMMAEKRGLAGENTAGQEKTRRHECRRCTQECVRHTGSACAPQDCVRPTGSACATQEVRAPHMIRQTVTISYG